MEVEDIGNTVAYAPDLQENSTTITSAEIVAVPELDKYKGCLCCKARVEPLDSGLGRCSKEDCQMLQKYDVCPEHLSAKIMLLSVSGLVSLYGQNLLEMAGVKDGKVTEEILLEVLVFMSVTYNSQNVITGFVTHKTSV